MPQSPIRKGIYTQLTLVQFNEFALPFLKTGNWLRVLVFEWHRLKAFLCLELSSYLLRNTKMMARIIPQAVNCSYEWQTQSHA
jgi:hypothetical protein